MNRAKIVKELNKWAKKEFGSFYCVEDDGDLTMSIKGRCVIWFTDFKKDKFKFTYSSDDLSVKLIKEGIIEKFYDKAVELMSECESKYTVQVLPSKYGFLYKLKNDLSYLTTSDLRYDCAFRPQWSYFTQSEIERLKKRDDVSIDWNKAIIEEVKENEND